MLLNILPFAPSHFFPRQLLGALSALNQSRHRGAAAAGTSFIDPFRLSGRIAMRVVRTAKSPRNDELTLRSGLSRPSLFSIAGLSG